MRPLMNALRVFKNKKGGVTFKIETFKYNNNFFFF